MPPHPFQLRRFAAACVAIALLGACENQSGGAKPVDLPPKNSDAAPSARPPSPGRGLDGVPAARQIDPADRDPGTTWSIVLGTFSGENHARDAKDARDKLAERIPEFGAAFVHSTPTGSMILFGRYQGPEDPAARKEVKRIQAYEYKGARPFATAMLVRPETKRRGPTGPNDLRTLRVANPNVDPLYTLQVAVWADFDGSLSLETLRKQAEAYTMTLRAKGLQAFYHHDEDLKMSVVTVGGFGADAYNPRSTLYSPDVSALMKKFPHQLVNGQPLMLKADARDPKSREFAQPCMLVLVPKS
jgi:hypothetical protein